MDLFKIENDLLLELKRDSDGVEVVHTHISMVFLTHGYALKVKKPVNFGFLDFTTLERRHYFCHQELILNRRLARDIYLDIIPIRERNGVATLKGGPGRIIEYAILMKRVPQESLLKYKLLNGELSVEELERISRHIAQFHLSAKGSEEISHFGRPEVFKVNTDENFSQTEPYIGKTIEKEAWEYLKEWTERFYEINRDLFYERVNAQRIKDCHGDLHMEHIALMGDEVVILDCIEFNHRFRYGDTLNDIAFLIMDMEYNGLEKASKLVWDFYSRYAKEEGSGKLLTFYKVYRAYVRGKVTSFLIEGSLPEEEKEIVSERAKRYFEIALSYAKGISP